MASIALIGPDGAGKTTLTRMLSESGLLPIRYLYMGVSVPSSNLALPSSRLAEWLKSRLARGSNVAPSSGATRLADGNRRARPKGRAWAAARLVNRLAEEWFRQIVSWYYQLQGYAVLYDRHFVLDYAPEVVSLPGSETLDNRLHRWCLTNLYPSPDLVIYLDAPGEVLFARKGELTVEELERRRQAFLRHGEQLNNFVCVDATQPLEQVYEEVARQVVRFCGSQGQPGRRRRSVARVERHEAGPAPAYRTELDLPGSD